MADKQEWVNECV